MPCSQKTPTEPAIISLMVTAEAFAHVSPSDDVLDAYLDVREKLWEVIEKSIKPALYTHTWNVIHLQAQSSLIEFLQGNIDALDILKERVRSSIELMP